MELFSYQKSCNLIKPTRSLPFKTPSDIAIPRLDTKLTIHQTYNTIITNNT